MCCSKYVGLLVGPNGGTIRQIKEESGCCSIQSPPRSDTLKYFTLTGGLFKQNFYYIRAEYGCLKIR